MQLPPFLQNGADPFGDARSVSRKLLALGLFPLFLCVFTGLLGTCLQQQHEVHVRLAREGVHVAAVITNLEDRVTRRRNQSADHSYFASFRYGVNGASDRTGSVSITQDEYRTMIVGAPLPIVVLPADPSVYALERVVIDSLSETPADIWGMAFVFGLCVSSVLSLLVGFGRARRRSFGMFRR